MTATRSIGRGLVPAVCLLTAAVMGCRRPEIGEPLPVAVEVVRLAEKPIHREMRYSATIKELQKAELSFKISGTVAELYQVADAEGRQRDVQEGDQVPAGAVLAKLDVGDYTRAWEIAKQRLAQAESQSQAAEAGADLAEKDFQRTQKLFQQNVATQQQYDDVISRCKTTAAQVDGLSREVQAARIAERQARDDLDNCSLKVPQMQLATVAARYIEKSERVTPPAMRAFLLIDLAKVRVAFGVPDTQVGELSLGQTLTASSEALGGKRFTGRVTKIAPAADLGTRTFPVEVTDRPARRAAAGDDRHRAHRPDGHGSAVAHDRRATRGDEGGLHRVRGRGG